MFKSPAWSQTKPSTCSFTSICPCINHNDITAEQGTETRNGVGDQWWEQHTTWMRNDEPTPRSNGAMTCIHLHTHQAPSSSSSLYLLSLPFPTADSHINSTILMLTSTYLLHALTIFSNSFFPPQSNPNANTTNNLKSFSSALSTSPSLLAWTPSISVLPTKHTDSVLTCVYTILTKSTARCQTNACEVFAIRSYALSYLIHTMPGTVEPNTFWDQATKFGWAFSKSVSSSLSSPTEDTATQIMLSTFSDHICESSAALTKSICMPFLFSCERGEMVEDDLHQITGKVERTWERMWRAAVKMIDRTAEHRQHRWGPRMCTRFACCCHWRLGCKSASSKSIFSCLSQMLKFFSCRTETNPRLVDPIPGYSFCLCENWAKCSWPKDSQHSKPSESGSADILT